MTEKKTMTDWAGKFVDPAAKATEDHQRAQTDEEKAHFPLPRVVTYGHVRGFVGSRPENSFQS